MATRLFVALALVLCIGSAGASPILVGPDGKFIGFYLGTSGIGGAFREDAVSDKGYRFTFIRHQGVLKRSGSNLAIGYASNDCTGQLLIDEIVPPGHVTPVADFTSSGNPPALVYVPQDSPRVLATALRSQRNAAGNCEPFNFGPTEFFQAFPNDPSVTGVPSAVLPTPLRVISSWLFRDGFEQSSAQGGPAKPLSLPGHSPTWA